MMGNFHVRCGSGENVEIISKSNLSTSHQVSEVMAQIVAKTTDIKSIYDPTVGSVSLLLTVKKHLSKDQQKDLSYYTKERVLF